MEHGIKVNKNEIITHKYNFGISEDVNTRLLQDCLKSIGFKRGVISDIMTYINRCDSPYFMFGVENNNTEFYVDSVFGIKTWNYPSYDEFRYVFSSIKDAYNIIDLHVHPFICKLFKSMIHDIYQIYTKNSDDIFNFYFKNENPPLVRNIKITLIQLLKVVNNNKMIDDYVEKYNNWYLHWLHISKKKDGSLQITPYFRNTKE